MDHLPDARPRPPQQRRLPGASSRTVALAAALLAFCPLGTIARAQRRMPAPPVSPPTIYHPDTVTCQPETIEGAFRAHLLPWADQPEEVQQRLRVLQGEMTRSSLRRCVRKGLLTADQAAQVERRLGLGSTTTPALTQLRPTAPSGDRP